jgi:AIPR protein
MSTEKNKTNTLIINDIMNSFKNKFHSDLAEGEPENSVFEKLVAYLITCRHAYDYDFNFQDISTGQSRSNSGFEMSIDSAAVIVNGMVISDIDDLANVVVNSGGRVNLSYVFTQAKNKGYFSDITSEYGKFITGVNSVLRAKSTDSFYTKGLNKFIEMKNTIESGSIPTEKGQKSITVDGEIKVYPYFVISGSEKSKEYNLRGAIKHIANNNENLDAIGNYKINGPLIVGYETLRKIYDDVFIGADAKFNMRNLFPFERENIQKHGIYAIYTGYLPFKEYKKIIQEDDGSIKANIFSENVRGYLDKTHINKSIKESLSLGADESGSDDGIGRDLFFAMNNGVTIITKHLQAGLGTGSLMQIKGYQIVNGCQTSNILHEYYSEYSDRLKDIQSQLPENYSNLSPELINKQFRDDMVNGLVDNPQEMQKKIDNAIECYDSIEKIESSICVPVRIIHTEKDSVVDLIVASTNTQNPVNELVLLSRSDFNKELEYYFKGRYNGSILYERRKNQYALIADSIKSKITMEDLLKAYASIYLQSPHESARYFGKLKAKATRKSPSVFSDTHNHESYYLAAKIYIDLDSWLREGKILSDYRRYRWHMIYAVANILDRDFFSRNRNSFTLMNEKIKFSRKRDKMDELLREYVSITALENGEKIKEIFSEAKQSIDDSIRVMQNKGIQVNEINKDAEFHKEIYKNIVK